MLFTLRNILQYEIHFIRENNKIEHPKQHLKVGTAYK